MLFSKFRRWALPNDCIRCRYGPASPIDNGHVVCKRCWKFSDHNISPREASRWKRGHVCDVKE